MQPLYVISTVFNPRRFRSRLKLYREFAKWVRDSGVKMATVEVTFGDRPASVTTQADPWNLQLFTRQEMWHKERALRLGLQHLCQLAPDWKYVAWMDTDIRLARPDWATEAVQLLQHYAVVQMFGEARWLDADNHSLFSARSSARDFEEHGKFWWGSNPGVTDYYRIGGHPGFAWAFRRDELNDIGGWLDVCVAGSGDLHMAASFMGNWRVGLSPGVSPGYRAAVQHYGELCERHVRGNVSYMPGAVDHYFHGNVKDRGYNHRWKLIDKHQYDPTTDLIADVQGLHKWNLGDPRVLDMAVEMRRSLAARNEDTLASE